MATIVTTRLSKADAQGYSTEQSVELPDSVKGFHVDLYKDDVITFGEQFLTTMAKNLFAEDGKGFAKGCFWVSETQISRRELILKGIDIPAATFTRCSQARNVPMLGASYREVPTSGKESPILYGEELFQALVKKAKLSSKLEDFNYELARAESSLAKLEKLQGHQLKVIYRSEPVFALKFNRKEEENWGSQSSHWTTRRVLFFEDVTK